MAGKRAPDYEAKRADIRAAAARLLSTEGFDRATPDRVAWSLGISVYRIHSHYRGRRGLLADIVDRHMDLLLARLEIEAPAALPGAERLHALAAAYAGVIEAATPEHFTVVYHHVNLPDEHKKAVRGRMRWVLALFAQALEDAAPGLAPEWAKVQALSLLAMLNATAVWFRDGGAIERADHARTAADMVLRAAGVARGKPAA